METKEQLNHLKNSLDDSFEKIWLLRNRSSMYEPPVYKYQDCQENMTLAEFQDLYKNLIDQRKKENKQMIYVEVNTTQAEQTNGANTTNNQNLLIVSSKNENGIPTEQ